MNQDTPTNDVRLPQIGDTIIVFGTGSYTATITEESPNHIFIKDEYGYEHVYEKSDVKTGHFGNWNNSITSIYAVDPKDSMLWQFYTSLSKK